MILIKLIGTFETYLRLVIGALIYVYYTELFHQLLRNAL